jgi:hypothetical protein
MPGRAYATGIGTIDVIHRAGAGSLCGARYWWRDDRRAIVIAAMDFCPCAGLTVIWRSASWLLFPFFSYLPFGAFPLSSSGAPSSFFRVFSLLGKYCIDALIFKDLSCRQFSVFCFILVLPFDDLINNYWLFDSFM